MEKLLYKANRLMCRWTDKIVINVAVYQAACKEWDRFFSGMKFSKNINGRIFCNPSIALTFLSNICIIPDRLLLSRACFRLYRRHKDSENYTIEKNICKKIVHLIKNDYFCKLKIGLKNIVKLYQDLIKNCQLFLGRDTYSNN